jgi:hypothetical protein
MKAVSQSQLRTFFTSAGQLRASVCALGPKYRQIGVEHRPPRR